MGVGLAVARGASVGVGLAVARGASVGIGAIPFCSLAAFSIASPSGSASAATFACSAIAASSVASAGASALCDGVGRRDGRVARAVCMGGRARHADGAPGGGGWERVGGESGELAIRRGSCDGGR